jgi:hypothetical protein
MELAGCPFHLPGVVKNDDAFVSSVGQLRSEEGEAATSSQGFVDVDGPAIQISVSGSFS